MASPLVSLGLDHVEAVVVPNPSSAPSSAPSSPVAPARRNAPAVEELARKLLQAVSASGDAIELFGKVNSLVTDALGGEMSAYFERIAGKHLRVATVHAPAAQRQPQSLVRLLSQVARDACGRGQVAFSVPKSPQDPLAAAAPVFIQGQPPEAVTVCLHRSGVSKTHVCLVLQLAASYVTLWRVLRKNREAANLQEDLKQADLRERVLEILIKSQSQTEFAVATSVLAAEFQTLLGCHSTALAVAYPQNNRVELAAASHVNVLDRNSEYVEALEEAMRETVLLDRPLCWPPRGDDSTTSLQGHQHLATLAERESVRSWPLMDAHGAAIGAWLVLGDDEYFQRPKTAAVIDSCLRPLASSLHVLQAGRKRKLSQTWAKALRWAQSRKIPRLRRD